MKYLVILIYWDCNTAEEPDLDINSKVFLQGIHRAAEKAISIKKGKKVKLHGGIISALKLLI